MTELVKSSASQEDQWIAISDMMAALMVIFLFISITYIQSLNNYFDAVSDDNAKICNDLREEFEQDKQHLNMSICENGLLISFANDSNFETGRAVLSAQFESVLIDFFPRLMSVIMKNKESISELRIEGHTDSTAKDEDELRGYLYNTELSQDRSRNVMKFCLNLIKSNEKYMEWSFSHVTAHGMSSSERIFNDNKVENFDASRRVEFRLRTLAEEHLIDLTEMVMGDETQ